MYPTHLLQLRLILLQHLHSSRRVLAQLPAHTNIRAELGDSLILSSHLGQRRRENMVSVAEQGSVCADNLVVLDDPVPELFLFYFAANLPVCSDANATLLRR